MCQKLHTKKVPGSNHGTSIETQYHLYGYDITYKDATISQASIAAAYTHLSCKVRLKTASSLIVSLTATNETVFVSRHAKHHRQRYQH